MKLLLDLNIIKQARNERQGVPGCERRGNLCLTLTFKYPPSLQMSISLLWKTNKKPTYLRFSKIDSALFLE